MDCNATGSSRTEGLTRGARPAAHLPRPIPSLFFFLLHFLVLPSFLFLRHGPGSAQRRCPLHCGGGWSSSKQDRPANCTRSIRREIPHHPHGNLGILCVRGSLNWPCAQTKHHECSYYIGNNGLSLFSGSIRTLKRS